MSRRRRKRPYSGAEPTQEQSLGQRVSPAGWLLLGLLVGLAMALYYAWVVDPVVYTNANPSRLGDAYQREYILMVSQSLADNGDWLLAEQRLNQLRDPNLQQTLSDLLDAEVKAQNNPEKIRNLAKMAQLAGVEGQAVAIFAPTEEPELLPTPTVALVLQETAVASTDQISPTASLRSPNPSSKTTPIPTSAATAAPPRITVCSIKQLFAKMKLSHALK